jgi:hypothetical protein
LLARSFHWRLLVFAFTRLEIRIGDHLLRRQIGASSLPPRTKAT